MEGENKVSLRRFSADQKIASSWKECVSFGTSYSTSNKLLLVARHILTTGLHLKNLFKVGSVKFANSLSPPSIVKKVRTGSKSSQGT